MSASTAQTVFSVLFGRMPSLRSIRIGLSGLLLCALFGGCASMMNSGPHFSPVAAPPSGYALIYVYRQGGARPGALVNYNVWDLGGRSITTLPHGGCYAFYAEPQDITLRLLDVGFLVNDNPEVNFNKFAAKAQIEAGQTYYFKFKIAGWRDPSRLEVVDNATGEKEIAGCTYVSTPLDSATMVRLALRDEAKIAAKIAEAAHRERLAWEAGGKERLEKGWAQLRENMTINEVGKLLGIPQSGLIGIAFYGVLNGMNDDPDAPATVDLGIVDSSLVGMQLEFINKKLKSWKPRSTANTTLLEAAKAGDLSAVQKALDEGADVNAEGLGGGTPLFLAALKNQPEVVKLLLDKGADINRRPTNAGLTPLMTAAFSNHVSVVELLLERGADTGALVSDRSADTGDKATALGVTALELAAGNGAIEAVERLLAKGVDINDRNSAALCMAVAHQTQPTSSNSKMVKLLLERGADPNGTGPTNTQPLLMAAGLGDDANVRLLLEKGADINAKSVSGKTSLMLSAALGKKEAVRILLSGGASINEVSPEGMTALALAKQGGHMEIAQMIGAAGGK
ncbi:MAG TPA: ankyrin repeat domain-containing protein [Opitutus sp.]|nr:ankyrin repeat domain-containing protein [Opitutus sp.]